MIAPLDIFKMIKFVKNVASCVQPASIKAKFVSCVKKIQLNKTIDANVILNMLILTMDAFLVKLIARNAVIRMNVLFVILDIF